VRQRDRYVVIRASKAKLEAILENLSKRFTRLKLVEEADDAGILRCSHLQLSSLKECLTASGVEILGVSGTIRRAKLKFLRKG